MTTSKTMGFFKLTAGLHHFAFGMGFGLLHLAQRNDIFFCLQETQDFFFFPQNSACFQEPNPALHFPQFYKQDQC